jgi:hypothetical protein
MMAVQTGDKHDDGNILSDSKRYAVKTSNIK